MIIFALKVHYMFSSGQWIFVAFFVVAFVIVTVIAYRKDLRVHRKYYKGTLWVLVGFILFLTALVLIKKFM